MSLNWLLDSMESRMVEAGYKVYHLDDKKMEYKVKQ
jgi:hypothetical protein